MIVDYGDFYFDEEDGRTVLTYAPDPDSKELVQLGYVERGDSLANVVARAWAHQQAPAGVIDAVKGTRK